MRRFCAITSSNAFRISERRTCDDAFLFSATKNRTPIVHKGRVVRDGLASDNIKETVSKSSRNGHTSKTAEYSTNGN